MRFDDDFDRVVIDPQYRQYFVPKTEQLSSTSISVTISTLGMPGTPATYKVTYQYMATRKVSLAASVTVTSPSNPQTITGLFAGGLYKITTQAIGPSGEIGNQMTVFYQLNKNAGQPAPVVKSDAKSFLQLEGGKSSDNKYKVATKSFSAVQIPVPISSNPPNFGSNSYHYSFGTAVLMPAAKTDSERQEAGFGFFIKKNDKSIDSGYIILLSTSSTAEAQTHKPVRIAKITGSKNIKVLTDTQEGNASTKDIFYSGSIQYLDVKVKVTGQRVEIKVYVNGFVITTTDINSTSNPVNAILQPTDTVALIAASGKVAFDYAYASAIKQESYEKDEADNLYIGQFSDDYLQNYFGDLVYDSDIDDGQREVLTDRSRGEFYDEFGTVVREIYRNKVQFTSAPAEPIGWNVGGNNLVKIISENRSSFGGEVFVLNNTSTTVPLSDGQANALSVFGTTIGFSGELVYSTNPLSEYVYKEPLTYESAWIQNEADVKNLANWIRSNVVNKAKIVTIRSFGNPLISVGDIISVKYEYQGFYGTEKIIVTAVSHIYNEGLETEITGRTIS